METTEDKWMQIYICVLRSLLCLTMFYDKCVCVWGGGGRLVKHVLSCLKWLCLPSPSVVILMPQSKIPISILTESNISKSSLADTQILLFKLVVAGVYRSEVRGHHRLNVWYPKRSLLHTSTPHIPAYVSMCTAFLMLFLTKLSTSPTRPGAQLKANWYPVPNFALRRFWVPRQRRRPKFMIPILVHKWSASSMAWVVRILEREREREEWY